MAFDTDQREPARRSCPAGFSLLELLASIAIITLVMSAVFAFMFQAQKRFQASMVSSESSQSARAALEVLTQEIGQAGYNPAYYPHRTCSAAITADAGLQCVTLNDISQINLGDWLSVDTGVNHELVQVVGVTGNGCAPANQVRGVFQMSHNGTGTPFPVISYKMPYPTGIMMGTGASDDRTLLIFGDINNDAVINYLVYSLSPTTSPATTVTVNGQTYTLYNLYRSITPVTFTAGAVNSRASPLVQNVLYDLTNQRGPTGQPLFAYPNLFTVGIVPNLMTVVGTVAVTISVAVNPRSLETNRVEWYTMATQIRPLNLAAAVAVNQAGGWKYLPRTPLGLPMSNPSPYY